VVKLRAFVHSHSSQKNSVPNRVPLLQVGDFNWSIWSTAVTKESYMKPRGGVTMSCAHRVFTFLSSTAALKGKCVEIHSALPPPTRTANLAAFASGSATVCSYPPSSKLTLGQVLLPAVGSAFDRFRLPKRCLDSGIIWCTDHCWNRDSSIDSSIELSDHWLR
jgi:hypothetical protein